MSELISVCGKNKTPDFLSPYKVKSDSEELRKIMEEHFIKIQAKTEQSFSFKQ